MKENIFDLQTEISNLIIKHGLENGDYAIIFKKGNLMLIDLSQLEIPKIDETKEEK